MSAPDISDADTPHLKAWIIKRLENISDADSDVLADYVIALVKSEEPEAQIRQNCVDNLQDFLGEHTAGFINDAFIALKTKSFLPGNKPAPQKPAPAPASQLNASAASFQAPNNTPPASAPTGPAALSKKRTWNNREDPEPQQARQGDRPMKQLRRGGQGGRGGFGHGGPIPQMPDIPGLPPFDPNNPMAAIMAMQAMGFPMPGFDQMQAGFPAAAPKSRGRCRDYDTKGFCSRGSNCPYEHGTDHMVVPEEYDPANSQLLVDPSSNQNGQQSAQRGRGRDRDRGRGRGAGRGGPNLRGRGGRSALSAMGPSNDPANVSIVVEQIPEDKFNEDSVRGFFQEFGSIDKVDLQNYKHLAVVNFADHDSAQRAYESPKVIFDNRFVKVYWQKSATNGHGHFQGQDGANGGQGEKEDDDMGFSQEEFEKRQAEAQRVYEEKARKKAEAEREREALDRKNQALAEERRKLMAALAAKTAKQSGAASSPAPTTAAQADDAMDTDAPKTAKQKATEALKAKLAELEAEAKSIGLPAEDTQSASPSFGGFGGRGSWHPVAQRARRPGRGNRGFAGVVRLDNRPKTVRLVATDQDVSFENADTREALSSFLESIGASNTVVVEEAPDDKGKDTTFARIEYSERYKGEGLFQQVRARQNKIPGVGAVDVSWAPAGPQQAVAATPAAWGPDAGDGAATGTFELDESERWAR